MSDRVTVQLIGTDGNAFALIGRVTSALKLDGQHELAAEFKRKAFACESYDDLLVLIMEYVEVE